MKRYNIGPLLLLVYLGVMCYMGYPEYVAGNYSAFRYFGVILLSLACIVGVRYTMKRRHDQRSNDNH